MKKSRVLIADDREDNLYLLRVLLEGHDYEVLSARNGAEALELARRMPPDLVITDILMPVMDGFTLCREWKKDDGLKSIPLVFYTATYTDERDREFALSLGAERFIVKPEEPDAFLQMVEETIYLAGNPPARDAHAAKADVGSEAAGATSPPPQAAADEEPGFLRQYSEVLVRKLEAKMEQLDLVNRRLEEDVAARRAAEQAAAEHAHFLEELLAAIPVPIAYKGTDLRYLGGNQAFADMVHRPVDEIVGLTIFDVLPAELALQHDAIDRALLASPETAVEDEFEIEDEQSGRVLIVLAHKAVFRDISGKPAGIVAICFDVAGIRRAERELAASAERLRHTLEGVVTALSTTAEMRDPYTAGHQRRVADLACAIAGELGWEPERIGILRVAALLHDIGKIVVPAEILVKPGALSEMEMEIIRQHAAAGAKAVGDIDFEGNVIEMVRHHHERLDGSGYPGGLHDEEIIPEVRVLAVADVVEAMISHRPYRPAHPLEVALAEIEGNAGRLYDAGVCAACVRLFREKGIVLAV